MSDAPSEETQEVSEEQHAQSQETNAVAAAMRRKYEGQINDLAAENERLRQSNQHQETPTALSFDDALDDPDVMQKLFQQRESAIEERIDAKYQQREAEQNAKAAEARIQGKYAVFSDKNPEVARQAKAAILGECLMLKNEGLEIDEAIYDEKCAEIARRMDAKTATEVNKAADQKAADTAPPPAPGSAAAMGVSDGKFSKPMSAEDRQELVRQKMRDKEANG